MMEFFNTPHGVCLEAEFIGEAGAPLVVLAPGAGAPMEFWPRRYVDEIARHGFRVLRFCHRDTGLSTHFDAPYAIDALLEDMWALVDQFETGGVHLVGHSMGGYMALIALCASPARVRSATVISAGPTVSPERYAEFEMRAMDDDTWTELLKNTPVGDFDRDLPGWLNSWRFLNGERRFDEAAAAGYTRALYRGDRRNAMVAENHIHAMTTLSGDLPEKLARVVAPLLILHGDKDPLVPFSHGRALSRIVDGARLVPLRGAGHMFFDPAAWEEIARAQLSLLRAL